MDVILVPFYLFVPSKMLGCPAGLEPRNVCEFLELPEWLRALAANKCRAPAASDKFVPLLVKPNLALGIYVYGQAWGRLASMLFPRFLHWRKLLPRQPGLLFGVNI